MENKVTDFSGKWKMKSSENFEELLKALSVNVFLRKIAVAAASSPAVEITQQGETLSIKTSTSVRTTNVSFTVGQSFNEATVDGRPCTSFPKWETDRKISCEQTLLKGDGPKTSWTRELTNDGELILGIPLPFTQVVVWKKYFDFTEEKPVNPSISLSHI